MWGWVGSVITGDLRQGWLLTIRSLALLNHTLTHLLLNVFFKEDTREKTEGIRNEETSEGK